jgi:hypothetical protein
MRAGANNPTMLPPQFYRGSLYLGDFDAFEYAIEDDALNVRNANPNLGCPVIASCHHHHHRHHHVMS